MERLGFGVELKPSYFSQAIRNLEMVDQPEDRDQQVITFDLAGVQGENGGRE